MIIFRHYIKPKIRHFLVFLVPKILKNLTIVKKKITGRAICQKIENLVDIDSLKRPRFAKFFKQGKTETLYTNDSFI